MNLTEFKEHLVLQVESAASWRAEKSVQYPDDERNQRCAKTLTALAAKLAALPSDDPDLKRLWWEWYRPRRESEIPEISNLVETEASVIGRYGFDAAENGTASDFLRELGTASMRRGRDEHRAYD